MAKNKKAAPTQPTEETVVTEETIINEEEQPTQPTEETVVTEPDPEPKTTVTEVFLYNKNQRLMVHATAESHGKYFYEYCQTIMAQPRRVGWTMVVR